ncbi:MAG: DUF5320 domain-containing protein [Spirochaetales bacterium]|nr:DUF5320 domain-containing protein [Spirochaetales bacterium]
MPRGDGTGPAGMGPMTGRAAGYCAGYGVPGFMNPYGGRMGAGFGRGRGRWWGAPYPGAGWGSGSAPYGPYPYAPAYSAEQEKEALQNQVKFFEDQLAALKERMEELEADSSKKK